MESFYTNRIGMVSAEIQKGRAAPAFLYSLNLSGLFGFIALGTFLFMSGSLQHDQETARSQDEHNSGLYGCFHGEFTSGGNDKIEVQADTYHVLAGKKQGKINILIARDGYMEVSDGYMLKINDIPGDFTYTIKRIIPIGHIGNYSIINGNGSNSLTIGVPTEPFSVHFIEVTL